MRAMGIEGCPMNTSKRRHAKGAEPARNPAVIQPLPRQMLLNREADLVLSVGGVALSERLAFEAAALREAAGHA